jgi:hypothetical protein
MTYNNPFARNNITGSDIKCEYALPGSWLAVDAGRKYHEVAGTGIEVDEPSIDISFTLCKQ